MTLSRPFEEELNNTICRLEKIQLSVSSEEKLNNIIYRLEELIPRLKLQKYEYGTCLLYTSDAADE